MKILRLSSNVSFLFELFVQALPTRIPLLLLSPTEDAGIFPLDENEAEERDGLRLHSQLLSSSANSLGYLGGLIFLGIRLWMRWKLRPAAQATAIRIFIVSTFSSGKSLTAPGDRPLDVVHI